MARVKNKINITKKRSASKFNIDMVVKFGQELIEKYGSSSITIREIAKKMNCSIGTLYKLFKNNEEMMHYINAKTLDDMQNFIESNINATLKDINIIKEMAKLYIEFARKNYNRWSAIFESRFTRKDPLPNWYEIKATNLFHFLEKPLLSFLKDEKITALAIRVVWSGIHGICILNLTQKLIKAKDKSAELLTDSLIENYLQGLKASDC